MKPYSLQGRSATVGSNLRGKALAIHRAAIASKLDRPFDRLAREYRQATRRLFSKADRRAAAEIARRVRQQYHTKALSSGTDGRKWAAGEPAFRAQLRRELLRTFPNYRRWEAIAKEHRRDYKALTQREMAALVDRHVHVNFADVLPPDAGESYEFTPPFEWFDTTIIDTDSADVDDLSLTDPAKGYLINRINYAQDYQPLVYTDIYHFNWIARYWSTTVCGTTFTSPSAGRLRIRATLQNYYNNIVVALRNQWGFSEGYVTVWVRLVINVIRPGQVLEYSTTLVSDGYDSPGGAEATYQFPSMDSVSPYVFEATTDEVFAANSTHQIMAGTQIIIRGEVDDMAIYVNALLGWQLQKLSINIV